MEDRILKITLEETQNQDGLTLATSFHNVPEVDTIIFVEHCYQAMDKLVDSLLEKTIKSKAQS